MAVLPVLVYPDARLKQVSELVSLFDDELATFVSDLEQTMDEGPPSVGISAPQVGRFQRICIVDVSGFLAMSLKQKRKIKSSNNGRMRLINPEIIERNGEQVGREGCLSVPDYTGNVSRATDIVLAAVDAAGKKQTFECSGFEARAVQHELDHLDGKLFLDRLVSARELFRRKVYK
ncbi:MAG: peptide deformylase [Proteobacteria bacterium]|nr:peptide deformylase [Pseudomonadota bacterium]